MNLSIRFPRLSSGIIVVHCWPMQGNLPLAWAFYALHVTDNMKSLISNLIFQTEIGD
jgi:hypothetical protein